VKCEDIIKIFDTLLILFNHNPNYSHPILLAYPKFRWVDACESVYKNVKKEINA